jgi:hypothetical protein
MEIFKKSTGRFVNRPGNERCNAERIEDAMSCRTPMVLSVVGVGFIDVCFPSPPWARENGRFVNRPYVLWCDRMMCVFIAWGIYESPW